jgi:hypothetical protein
LSLVVVVAVDLAVVVVLAVLELAQHCLLRLV